MGAPRGRIPAGSNDEPVIRAQFKPFADAISNACLSAPLLGRSALTTLASLEQSKPFAASTRAPSAAQGLVVLHPLAQPEFDPIRAVKEAFFQPGAEFEAPLANAHLLMRADFGETARIEHRPAAADANTVGHGLLKSDTEGLLLAPARGLAPALSGIHGQPCVLVEIARQEHELPQLRIGVVGKRFRRLPSRREGGKQRQTANGVDHGLAPPSSALSRRYTEFEETQVKFFVDTAEIEPIRELAATGLLDGVTTNPSLIAKSGRDFMEVTKEICGIVDGPVSAEVVALDHETMMKEAEILRKIANNVCIKVPLTVDGLKTCKALTGEGTMVNVTLCFSANQALLAAKAGATFISPFVGRHDDNGFDGMDLIEDIRLIYDNYNFATEILVASVRHTTHVLQAAKIGADVMTAPPAVIHALFKHVLTDKGIEGFMADWAKTGQSIL